MGLKKWHLDEHKRRTRWLDARVQTHRQTACTPLLRVASAFKWSTSTRVSEAIQQSRNPHFNRAWQLYCRMMLDADHNQRSTCVRLTRQQRADVLDHITFGQVYRHELWRGMRDVENRQRRFVWLELADFDTLAGETHRYGAMSKKRTHATRTHTIRAKERTAAGLTQPRHALQRVLEQAHALGTRWWESALARLQQERMADKVTQALANHTPRDVRVHLPTVKVGRLLQKGVTRVVRTWMDVMQEAPDAWRERCLQDLTRAHNQHSDSVQTLELLHVRDTASFMEYVELETRLQQLRHWLVIVDALVGVAECQMHTLVGEWITVQSAWRAQVQAIRLRMAAIRKDPKHRALEYRRDVYRRAAELDVWQFLQSAWTREWETIADASTLHAAWAKLLKRKNWDTGTHAEVLMRTRDEEHQLQAYMQTQVEPQLNRVAREGERVRVQAREWANTQRTQSELPPFPVLDLVPHWVPGRTTHTSAPLATCPRRPLGTPVGNC